MPDYITVRGEASDELTEKRSRFIARVLPVPDGQRALELVAQIKKENWEARHTAWAYRLAGGESRSSDDGEPQGTAGAPILDVIVRSGLSDTLVAVTRYFGGVLLGTGGLVRAYSGAASLGIASAKRRYMRQGYLCSLSCGYDRYGRISSLISECGAPLSADFGEVTKVNFWLARDKTDLFSKRLADLTNGGITHCVGDEMYLEDEKEEKSEK